MTAVPRFFLGADTETTGLSPAKDDRIVEVALIAYNPVTEARMGQLVKRMNPERSIPAEAQRVHGITFSDVAAEPTFAFYAAKIYGLMQNAEVLVMHNAAFDLAFFFSEFERVKIKVDEAAWCAKTIDTAEARWACFDGKTPQLGELCFALGVPYDKALAHAAEYDVECCVRCYFEGSRRGFFPTLVEEKVAA